MSGSKTWNISRKDVKKDPLTGRWHNPTKFDELGNMIDGLSNLPANRMCRKILEETANIVQHNDRWNDVSLKTDVNSTRTTFKITIIYDGGFFVDPVERKLEHVLDSSNIFPVYEREKPDIALDGTVTIKIKFGFKSEDLT
jgi:hypothetical protein